jgi:hypothetical protein
VRTKPKEWRQQQQTQKKTRTRERINKGLRRHTWRTWSVTVKVKFRDPLLDLTDLTAEAGHPSGAGWLALACDIIQLHVLRLATGSEAGNDPTAKKSKWPGVGPVNWPPSIRICISIRFAYQMDVATKADENCATVPPRTAPFGPQDGAASRRAGQVSSVANKAKR